MTIPPPPPPPFDPNAAGGPYGPGGGYGGYTGPPSVPGASQWGYPAPPGWGPPPPRRRTGWVIAGICAVLALVLIAGFVAWKAFFAGKESTSTAGATTSAASSEMPSGDASSSVQPTSDSTSVSAPSPAPSTTGKPAPPAAGAQACNGAMPTPGPRTPAGWLTVLSPRNLAYDVPADWVVNECTTLMGWEKPCAEGPFGFCPVRTMSGTAKLPYAGCPKMVVAMSGVPGAKNLEDINQAVQAEAGLVADIYTSKAGVVPKVSLGEPTPLTIGGSPAVKIVADVTGRDTTTETAGCEGAPSAKHVMVATKVPGQPGCVLFVLALDQGVRGSVDPALADQILTTLRVAG